MNNHDGWIGDIEHVIYVLGLAGADRDGPDGPFHVYGAHVVIGLGGRDCVIGSDVEYAVDGKRAPLAALLGSTSYGTRVKVF
jgi:hypothetical protein